jgi:hypothetical protein
MVLIRNSYVIEGGGSVGGETISLDRSSADKGEVINWVASNLVPNNIYRVGIYDPKINDLRAPVEFVTYTTSQSGIYRIPEEIDYGSYSFVLQILKSENRIDTFRVRTWEDRARTNITISPAIVKKPKISVRVSSLPYNSILDWFASDLIICKKYRVSLWYDAQTPFQTIEEFHADSTTREGHFLLNVPARKYLLVLEQLNATWVVVSSTEIEVTVPTPISPPFPPPTPPPAPMPTIPTWVWVAIGIGIAATGGGIAYYLLRK